MKKFFISLPDTPASIHSSIHPFFHPLMLIKQSGPLVTALTGKPRYLLGKEGTQEVQLWWSPVNTANKLDFVAAGFFLFFIVYFVYFLYREHLKVLSLDYFPHGGRHKNQAWLTKVTALIGERKGRTGAEMETSRKRERERERPFCPPGMTESLMQKEPTWREV